MTDLFLSVLGISVSVSALVILLFLFSPFLHKRYAAKWKYLIWCVLALRLVIPLGWAGGNFAADILKQWKSPIAPAAESRAEEASDGRLMPAGVVVEIPPRMTTPFRGQAEKGVAILDVLAFVWALVGIFIILINMISYRRYRRRVLRTGTLVKDAVLLQQLLKCKRELGIRRTVPVVEFSGASSPMLMGFLNPVLILPGESYSGKELFFILKHELVHLKRKDTWLKFLFLFSCAVHWFNPVIWFMQKEAAVDMELACDERVVQGADFAVRKAYTETLLATLHRGGSRGTILSTGFYGGKEIMKKRFEDILSKAGKKNGRYILACAVLLAVSAGTLAGCSIVRDKAESAAGGTESEETAGGETAGAGEEELTAGGEFGGSISAGEETGEDSSGARVAGKSITLRIMKEGMEEEKQAGLVVENGYVLYLPDGEWQKEEADLWRASANEDVRLWVAGFETGYQVEQLLADEGYVPDETGMVKKEENIVYHVRLYEAETGRWCVFYCYPTEAEEGWGSELPVIADTFAVLLPEEHITETGALSAQVLGYISGLNGNTVTIDRQDWVTSESPDWKPEYDADAGFEIVDLEGEDVTYPIRGDCTYHVLENHQGESVELGREEFERYLRETDFPIFWAVELEDGQVIRFAEWYLP